MAAAVFWAALALGFAIMSLVAFIVGLRAFSRWKQRQEGVVRPGLERMVAEYLVDPSADPPPRPADRAVRRFLRSVVLDDLIELRGRERERLTVLLESSGLVRDTIVELGSWSALTRRRAADALAQMRSREASDALLERLADRHDEVRLACARALAELGDERYVEPLLRTVEDAADRNSGAVADVLLVLGSRSPSALERIWATTTSETLRRLVAAVVGELRLVEMAPVLRDVLTQGDDELIARAARALGLMGDGESTEPLIGLLDDPERAWFVRAVAARSLGKIGDDRAVPVLEHTLESESWQLVTNSVEALALLGQKGRTALERAARSHDGTTGALIGVGLGA